MSDKGNWHDEPDNATPDDQPEDRTDIPDEEQVESKSDDGTPGAYGRDD
jgi:hypothetical protein